MDSHHASSARRREEKEKRDETRQERDDSQADEQEANNQASDDFDEMKKTGFPFAPLEPKREEVKRARKNGERPEPDKQGAGRGAPPEEDP